MGTDRGGRSGAGPHCPSSHHCPVLSCCSHCIYYYSHHVSLSLCCCSHIVFMWVVHHLVAGGRCCCCLVLAVSVWVSCVFIHCGRSLLFGQSSVLYPPWVIPCGIHGLGGGLPKFQVIGIHGMGDGIHGMGDGIHGIVDRFQMDSILLSDGFHTTSIHLETSSGSIASMWLHSVRHFSHLNIMLCRSARYIDTVDYVAIVCIDPIDT